MVMKAKRLPAEARHDIIPELLRLPDGRRIRLTDVAGRVWNRTYYNLRTGLIKQVKGSRSGTAPYKYTIEERYWQAEATVSAIADRYGISQTQAQNIKYYSMNVVKRLAEPD